MNDFQTRLQRCVARCQDAAQESLPSSPSEKDILKAQVRVVRAGAWPASVGEGAVRRPVVSMPEHAVQARWHEDWGCSAASARPLVLAGLHAHAIRRPPSDRTSWLRARATARRSTRHRSPSCRRASWRCCKKRPENGVDDVKHSRARSAGVRLACGAFRLPKATHTHKRIFLLPGIGLRVIVAYNLQFGGS